MRIDFPECPEGLRLKAVKALAGEPLTEHSTWHYALISFERIPDDEMAGSLEEERLP